MLVRVSIELFVVTLCATVIGVWYNLAFPSAFLNEQHFAAAFGNDPSNSARLTWTAPSVTCRFDRGRVS